ncbi:MAG: PAS domain S-box protein [Candidatus Rokubacteria bacterium]|nr:PAS domain S-box protein [Candidatus Rokubacteria bacterium]
MAPSVVARYAFPFLAVALASLLRGVLVPVLGEGVPFILYFPTVVLCAWFGGLWPGLLSAALGGFVALYFFIPPYHSFKAQDPTALAQLTVFLVASTLISLLADRLHQARRRAQEGEARAREERERIHVTLTSVGDAVIATDDRGRVTLMNGVAQSLTGWSDADAMGRPLVDVFTILNEESRRPVESPVSRALREGQITGLANHTVLVSKDGREIPIDDSAAPIKDAAGTLLGAVLVFRDISQRRQVEHDRATLLDQERAARAEVERLAARQRHLQSVTDTALSPRALDDLVPELVGRLRAAMASDTATILLLAEDGVHLTPFYSAGLDEDPRADIRIPLDHGVAGRIALSDHGLIIDDLTTVEVVRPMLAERVKSLVGAPLKVGGRLLGILHAGAAEPRHFTDDDLGLLRLVADRAALAIERTRLDEAERAARVEADRHRGEAETIAEVAHAARASAEAAERRASFLAEASQLLGASLDYETTLASLARLAVPRMADLCAVDMVEEDGTVRRLAIAHVDPAKETLARELRERYPFEVGATSGVPQVLRTGQSEFLPEVSESLLERRTRDSEHLRLYRAIGVRSAIIAPLAARGRVLGALTLVYGESQRRYDSADLALAEDLAHRAALAIDNARLHRETEKAEQRLRLALEAGRMGTWEWTIATGALTWSSSLEAIHAFAPGTFPGTFEAFRSEIHAEDRDRVLRAIAAAVEDRRDHRVEYRIVRRDGAVRWVEGRGQLFSDADGQPERMLGICTDVTERKQTEERFRLAVEAAPTAMVMVDQRGTIRLVNALAEPLFGYTRPELLGQSIERLVPPRLRGGHSGYRGAFFSDPRQRAMGKGRELYALRKDGTEVPVEIGLSPLETADGLFVLAAVTDIAARKQAEHERAELLMREQAARQAAEAANRTKDQFLAVLSHELRQPLNTMLGWLSVLRHQRVDPMQQERALDAVERNTRAQARMIDDLLDIARIEAGKVTLERRAVSLGPLVAEIVESLQHEARAKALTLGTQLDPTARFVFADVDRLRQVLMNLLSNAIKYSPSGGHVQVRLTAEDGVVRIVVSDAGVGIEPDLLPHVFERFRQADAGSAGPRGGLGLGLAIVREILEMHGGAVEAQSDGRGRGATFTITLPMIAG